MTRRKAARVRRGVNRLRRAYRRMCGRSPGLPWETATPIARALYRNRGVCL